MFSIVLPEVIPDLDELGDDEAAEMAMLEADHSQALALIMAAWKQLEKEIQNAFV